MESRAFLIAQLVKNPPAMQETWVQSIPGLGRSPGEGKGCPLRYSGLENSMDCVVHGVAKRRTRLSDFHLLTYSSFSGENNRLSYYTADRGFVSLELRRLGLP